MTKTWRVRVVTLGLLAILGPVGPDGVRVLLAQAPTDVGAVRAQLDRRFDLLPIQDGVLLRPRGRVGDIRTIEVHAGAIAIDGQVVTGSEVRSRLGADADLVLRLSYLTASDLARISGVAPAAAGVPPAVAALPIPVPGADDSLATARERAREAQERAREAAREARERAREARDESRVERFRRGPFGRPNRPGDRVRFGGSVTVNEGETVEGDVVVIGGAARVFGHVNGDVVSVGGSAELGPKAEVTQDLVVIGGSLTRDAAAHVGGEVVEVGTGLFDWDWARAGQSQTPQRWNWNWGWANPFRGMSSLLVTTMRTAVLCLLCAIVVLFGGGYVDRIRAVASTQPLKAGAVGFLSQVLALPASVILVVVLVITIVGIPLLLLTPFLLLALAALALVGFTAVARHLGQWVLERFGGAGLGDYATTLAGVLLILAPLLLARLVNLAGGPLWFVSAPLAAVGFFVEYVAWTVGMGAALFTIAGGRASVAPPPLPQV